MLPEAAAAVAATASAAAAAAVLRPARGHSRANRRGRCTLLCVLDQCQHATSDRVWVGCVPNYCSSSSNNTAYVIKLSLNIKDDIYYEHI